MDKEDVVQILYELYYSAIKKNEIMPFAAKWRDLEIALLSEVKSHREAEMQFNISYMQNQKEMIKTYLQRRNTLIDLE